MFKFVLSAIGQDRLRGHPRRDVALTIVTLHCCARSEGLRRGIALPALIRQAHA